MQYEDDVEEGVKKDRLEEIVEVQRAISAERLERFVGREVDVLVDRLEEEEGSRSGGAVAGRRRGRRHLLERGDWGGRAGRLRAGADHGERRLRFPGGRADVTRSHELFDRAKRVLPGGVNSPVRAFRAVGGTPFFVAMRMAPVSGMSTAASTSTTSAPGAR